MQSGLDCPIPGQYPEHLGSQYTYDDAVNGVVQKHKWSRKNVETKPPKHVDAGEEVGDGGSLPFLLWTTRPFLSNIVAIWRRSRAQRCFPRVARGETMMAEYVEVSAIAKLGREAAPSRRVVATVASGKEWVVLRGEAILLVHHAVDGRRLGESTVLDSKPVGAE
jgi:hypothetical protein